MIRIPWPEVIHKTMVLLGFMALLAITSEANVKGEGKILPLHFDLFRPQGQLPTPLLANMCTVDGSVRETPRLPENPHAESCRVTENPVQVSVQ